MPKVRRSLAECIVDCAWNKIVIEMSDIGMSPFASIRSFSLPPITISREGLQNNSTDFQWRCAVRVSVFLKKKVGIAVGARLRVLSRRTSANH